MLAYNLVLTWLFDAKSSLWQRKDTTTWLGEWVEKLWQHSMFAVATMHSGFVEEVNPIAIRRSEIGW